MRRPLVPLALLSVLTAAHAVHATGPKLKVVATLPDFASIARELGGDRVEVETLLRGTQNPHFADAKPSMILKVNRADLLIVIGLGLEDGWLPVLITQARNEKVQVGAHGYLDASYAIVAQGVPPEPDRAMGDVHSGGNPHYYTSPQSLFRVAGAIRDKLTELDPAGREHYLRLWTAFADKYEKKLATWRERLAASRGTRVVVYHESWTYLLDWLGFQRVGSLEPKPGVAPTPAHVSRLLAQVERQGARLVIQEVYHPTKLSKLFARKAGAKHLVLPAMVGAEQGIDSIWDKIDRIVELVAQPD